MMNQNASINTSEIIDKCNKEEYQGWLISNGFAPEIARSYETHVSRIDDYALSTGLSDTSIYDIEEIEELTKLYELINQDEGMPARYRDCLIGLRRYITYKNKGEIDFVQNRSKSSIGDESGEKRAAYQECLCNQGLVSAAARNYGNWFNKANQYSIEHGYSKGSVYDIENEEELNSILSKINVCFTTE